MFIKNVLYAFFLATSIHQYTDNSYMKPNIFEYLNYREYLKSYYNHTKQVNKNFSHRYFCKRIGFSSTASLFLIMEGRRNMSKGTVPRFIKAMELCKKERQYFETLVSFNQAKDQESKRYYLELLYNLKENKIGKPIEDHQFEYLSAWYYPVIRELVLLPQFEENPGWIRNQLGNRISIRQARETLARLENMGFIKRDENGKLVQADLNLTTNDEVKDTVIYHFYQQMLTLAKDILSQTSGNGNEISGITMAVSKRQFEEIKKMVRDLENNIMGFLETNAEIPDTVSQLNIQFLNLLDGKLVNKGVKNA